MTIFSGTVSTSGTSYVIAIPREIIESLKLSKGMKVEMIYENDRITIPFYWSRLTYRCERILHEELRNFTEWMFTPNCTLHPYTYHILSSILLILEYVYIRTYGIDDFNVKFCRHLMKSLRTDVKTDFSQEVKKQIDEIRETSRFEETITLDFKDPNKVNYHNQQKIDKLKNIMPIFFSQFLSDRISMGGILQVTENGKFGSASYEYVKSLLDSIESREFQQFLTELFLMEHANQFSKASIEDPST